MTDGPYSNVSSRGKLMLSLAQHQNTLVSLDHGYVVTSEDVTSCPVSPLIEIPNIQEQAPRNSSPAAFLTELQNQKPDIIFLLKLYKRTVHQTAVYFLTMIWMIPLMYPRRVQKVKYLLVMSLRYHNLQQLIQIPYLQPYQININLFPTVILIQMMT
ncbi:uncharacterized protein LOC124363877 [Homalodisca vitripennis]|uniref:uncharacterized protein LOC124363877 n=2 Tax=Homalodisca vitripennis TaxID=197043 RepID=UPI001EEC3F2D|nr:uncharacterized protein LOC124363877 [Homalodisca vitripennis]